MRLINTHTLRLEEFLSDDHPPYAILSHTWAARESSLDEWLGHVEQGSSAELTSSGVSKVVKACELASANSITHLWVDTVCIDKSSSAELTEAINSMFHWFQEATTCLVYLSDIEIKSRTDRAVHERLVAGCRWLSRGWTLQELLAPLECHFFDRKWTFIDNKTSLAETLSKATGVNIKYLRGDVSVRRATIAERMVWMSERTTTRPEDLAYSLLGIFGVHMALLYGEGSCNAFRRLQEEIIRSLPPDETLLDWLWDDTVPEDWHYILAPSPHVFGAFKKHHPRYNVTANPSWRGVAPLNRRILNEMRMAGYQLPVLSNGKEGAHIVRSAEEGMEAQISPERGRDRDNGSIHISLVPKPRLQTRLVDGSVREFFPPFVTLEEITDADLRQEAISSDPAGSEPESIFTRDRSLASSQTSTSSQSLQSAAVKEVADALLSRRDLRDLYTLAASRVAETKYRVHLKGFIREFAAHLRDEASDYLETQLATFLSSAAGKISDEIRKYVGEPQQPHRADIAAQKRLAAWLSAQNELIPAEKETPVLTTRSNDTTIAKTAEAEAGQSDEETSDPGGQSISHNSITQVRGFMLSSNALKEHVQELKSWLRIDQLPPVDTEPQIEQAGALGIQSVTESDRVSARPALEVEESAGARFGEGSIETLREVSGSQRDLEQPNVEPSQGHRHQQDPAQSRSGPAMLYPAAEMERSNRRWSDLWRSSHLLQDLYELFIPEPEPGYRRLRWTCSCGTPLSGDFEVSDSDEDSVQELMNDLHHVLAIVEIPGEIHGQPGRKIFHQKYVKAFAGPSPEPDSNASARSSYQPGASASAQAGARRGDGTASGSQADPAQPPQQSGSDPQLYPPAANGQASAADATPSSPNTQFFEVCVNTGSHATRLKEIDLAMVSTDRQLFMLIWERYRQARGRGYRRWLLKPKDFHFVKFCVTRAGYDLAGIQEKPKAYPPKVELDEKRYHYALRKKSKKPEFMPANTFLHYLNWARHNRWDTHDENAWLKRLPKKLDLGILRYLQQTTNPVDLARRRPSSEDEEDDDVVYGWGVHILEGTNHLALCLFLLVGILAGIIVSAVISAIQRAQLSAIGVGAFVLTAVICLVGTLSAALDDS